MLTLTPVSAAERETIGRSLDAVLKDPSTIWVPLFVPSADMTSNFDYKRWAQDLPRMEDDPFVPAREDVEKLCAAYLRMGFWDFAYAVACLAYTGALELASIQHLIWEGYPGASKIWIRRGDVLIPVPMTGSIRTAFETWWCMSMGYASPTGKFLRVYPDEFHAHWRSLNSPIIEEMPFGTDDPDDALEQLQRAHLNVLNYPTFSRSLTDIEALVPDAAVKDGLVWVSGVPVGIAKGVDRVRAGHVRPKADAPWGWDWLQSAKESIPPRLYERAAALRRPAYAD